MYPTQHLIDNQNEKHVCSINYFLFILFIFKKIKSKHSVAYVSIHLYHYHEASISPNPLIAPL